MGNDNIFIKEFENDNIFVLQKNKIPYSAYSKKKTDITNKKMLCSYKYAYNLLKTHTNFDGIGIVLGETSKGNLSCIDIDNCINAGVISDFAQEIINLLDTYTEISQSKKGIHCLFYANKLGQNCKINNITGCKDLELYDSKRYIAITNNCINNIGIMERQAQCDTIYKKYFEKIKPAEKKEVEIEFKIINKNVVADYLKIINKAMLKDEKLYMYWYRNYIYNDESRNDLGLFQKLSYYTACNPVIMKELAFLSPYFMQKDVKHKNKWLKRNDYIKRTISKAIADYGSYKNEC